MNENCNKLKLNLGAGEKPIHGWVNVDARPECRPDVIGDITKISLMFSNADLIYACHVLEHFPTKPSSQFPVTWKEVLKDWYATLKPGGILRLSVPNFQAICEYYLETRNLDKLYGLLYGGQKNDFDFHFHAWDFNSLEKELQDIGFKEVHLYDRWKTDHSNIDDYSAAYLPHKDFIKGRLMSLNIQAVK